MATSSKDDFRAAGPGPLSVPGESTKTTTSLLETGAKALQSLKPINNFSQHVCTWAIYSQDMKRKIETHHHASRLNEDVLQCAVFDSDQSDARLIGVEYIVSDRLFATLPEDEKKLWHSHFYETNTGLWVTPGVPETVQQQELDKTAKTYGKFWLTWQADRGDKLPMGPPALMMSPQEPPEGQIPAGMIHERDLKYGISTSDKKNERASAITGPQGGLDPLADHWVKTGKGWATELKEVPAVPQ
eukprot:jgi/Mesen1/435/ME001000S10636